MDVKPLSWPLEYKRDKKLRRFLADIPVIGSDFRLHREFSRQLKARTHTVLKLWGDNPEVLRCLCSISPLIKEYFRWPNCYFIYSDPCEILFWRPQVGYDDLSGLEFTNIIIDEFSLSQDFFKDYASLTYGQFIEKLLRYINQSL